MKGVILAGGNATRLRPLTRVTNKHLLPVYNKPMIFYPIQTLAKAGIKDVLLVMGGSNPGDFVRLLGNGKEFGLREIHYTFQEGAGGIAEALSLAEDFADKEKIMVILGDNILEDDVSGAVQDFEKQKEGAKIFLKEVSKPQSYGVVELSGDKVVNIIEKPQNPPTNLAVVGLYLYDSNVFEIAKGLKPSARGELEITDVNNHYIKKGAMTYQVLTGWWGDGGESFDSLLEAQKLAAEWEKNQAK
ncbi:MAG: sugar phosphate nucleotidyltransferase [Patescibacteria group bacterium]|jgi:glucose-1-phosphate thymidylyltransferase